VTTGDADNIRQAQAVERDVIVLLAGAQAERVGLGRSSCPAGGVDFYEAVRRAGAICRTNEEMSAFLRWLQLRTYALVQSPTWRQPIDTLAARLLERRQLGARETRAIIRAAISPVRTESSIRHDDSPAASPKHERRRRAGPISASARPRSGALDDGSGLARHRETEPK
jgi:hypothetical protein